MLEAHVRGLGWQCGPSEGKLLPEASWSGRESQQLHTAALKGCTDVVRELLSGGASPAELDSVRTISPFVCCACRLRERALLAQAGQSPLDCALRSGHADTVRVVLLAAAAEFLKGRSFPCEACESAVHSAQRSATHTRCSLARTFCDMERNPRQLSSSSLRRSLAAGRRCSFSSNWARCQMKLR